MQGCTVGVGCPGSERGEMVDWRTGTVSCGRKGEMGWKTETGDSLELRTGCVVGKGQDSSTEIGVAGVVTCSPTVA